MKLSQLHAYNIERNRGVFVDPESAKYHRETYDTKEPGWKKIPDEWIVEGLINSDCRR